MPPPAWPDPGHLPVVFDSSLENDMDYGVIFLADVGNHAEVVLAEQQGYTHAWFGDSQMV